MPDISFILLKKKEMTLHFWWKVTRQEVSSEIGSDSWRKEPFNQDEEGEMKNLFNLFFKSCMKKNGGKFFFKFSNSQRVCLFEHHNKAGLVSRNHFYERVDCLKTSVHPGSRVWSFLIYISFLIIPVFQHFHSVYQCQFIHSLCFQLPHLFSRLVLTAFCTWEPI